MNLADRNSQAAEWEHELTARLPVFGHRNWIVVADAAYPEQSETGITTIKANVSQVAAVEKVLSLIEESHHVRANIYADLELDVVEELDAPGISEYRGQVSQLFQGLKVQRLLHERIIEKLDVAARLFSIFIIKTDMALPYTSVFFELDCGYWSADAEARVRSAMKSMSSLNEVDAV